MKISSSFSITVSNGHRAGPSRGFALIVTPSLMILLTLIAVGLLSLSSFSLRSSSSSLAMAEARSNARLAVQLALGQLQLTTGHDTRITASSGMVDSNMPSATGAWRSWEGTDHDVTGKPIVPDYGSKKIPGNPRDLPGTPGNGRFLGWLTSGSATESPDVTDFSDLTNNADEAKSRNYVSMVTMGNGPGSGSVTDPTRQVFIEPTLVDASKGSLVWWVSGENSKAMINTDRTPKPANVVAWQQRVRSNGRADAKFFELENLDTYALGTSIPSTGSLKLVNQTAELRRIHDLTAFSRGLLTNTATGGWRKDLSLMNRGGQLSPVSRSRPSRL